MVRSLSSHQPMPPLPLGEEALQSLLQPEAKPVLTRILTHHVVAGRFDANRILSGETSLKTLAGTYSSDLVEAGCRGRRCGRNHRRGRLQRRCALDRRVLMPPPLPMSPCQAFLERPCRGVPLQRWRSIGTAAVRHRVGRRTEHRQLGIPKTRKRLLGEFNRVVDMHEPRGKPGPTERSSTPCWLPET